MNFKYTSTHSICMVCVYQKSIKLLSLGICQRECDRMLYQLFRPYFICDQGNVCFLIIERMWSPSALIYLQM